MVWITVVKKETECQHDYPPLRTVPHVQPGSIYECVCGQRFVVAKNLFGRYYKPMKAWPRKPKPPPPPRTRIP